MIKLDGVSIKEAREKAGLSQRELAKEIGMSPEHLCRVERGRKGVSFSMAKLILAVLAARSGDTKRMMKILMEEKRDG